MQISPLAMNVNANNVAAQKTAQLADNAKMAKQDKELKEACKGFESMFLSMMYKQMRATVPENTLFGESNAQKIFQDMRDEELMKNVAESGGVGIADIMYRQLSPQIKAQMQAAQQGAIKAQEAAADIHRQ